MSLAEFKSVPLPKLGGLFTFLKPVDVPTGYSPNLQNVRFLPRAVLSRAGLVARMTKDAAMKGLAQYLPSNSDSTAFALVDNAVLSVVVGGFSVVVQFVDLTLNIPVGTQVSFFSGGLNPLHTVTASGSGTVTWIESGGLPGPGTITGGVLSYTHTDKTLISLDDSGNLDFQDPITGLPESLMRNVASAGALMSSKTAFGRIFLSFYKPDLVPAGPIRYWSGTRQTTCPLPVAGMTVIDSPTADAGWLFGNYDFNVLFEHIDGSLSLAGNDINWVTAGGFQPQIAGIPVADPVYNVVARWITLTPSFGSALGRFKLPQFRIGDNVTTAITFPSIGGGTTPEFVANGTYVGNKLTGDGIAASQVPTPPALPHMSPEGPAGAAAATDSVNAGSIAVGVHQVWVVFETLFGYLSKPSPAGSWTAAGGKKAVISSIPIGPWYVKARRLLFSASALLDPFYVSTFRIPDNVSTAVEVDFTDTNLLQGSGVAYLFKNFAAPDAMSMSVYGGRLAYWGAKNTIKIPNMGFDGGWDRTTGAPAGWLKDGTWGAGGYKDDVNSFAGDSYRIQLQGGANFSGMIENHDIASRLFVNVPYTFSIRAKRTVPVGGATIRGAFQAELFSPTAGSLGVFNVPATQISTTGWDEYSGQITLGLGSIPTDLFLRISMAPDAGGHIPGPNGNFVWVDHMQMFPTLVDTETSIIRLSNAFDPETFDGVSGLQSVALDNGEQITAVQQLRSFLYILKERSMHVTYDDGVNAPALWTQRQIDSTIGCGSPRGLVSSDTFIAFSGRSGAYMFTGARPQKISQEIQTTWGQINWQYAGTTHTLLNSQSKTIHFFVPMGTDVAPKNCMILDYSEGVGQEDDPGPRKWGRDLYPSYINGSIRFENSVITQKLFGSRPNTASNYFAGDKIYEASGTDDDGVAIDWFYETAYVKAGEQGQDLFGGIVFYAEGGGPDNGGTTGQMLVTLIGLDDVQQQSVLSAVLSSAPGKQYEIYANMENERARVRFEQIVEGSFGTIKGISVLSKPWAEQQLH